MSCPNCKALREANRVAANRYATVFKQIRDRITSAENIIANLKTENAALRKQIGNTETTALVKRSTKG